MNDQPPNAPRDGTSAPTPSAPGPSDSGSVTAAAANAGAPLFLVPLKFDPTKETKQAWSRRIVAELAASLTQRVRRQAVAALEAIADRQERINRVAADLESGQRLFAFLEPDELAALLDLDLDDTGDWDRTFLARRVDLDESGSAHPLAENLGLLEGRIPAGRFAILSARAEAIRAREDGPDLRLTRAEKALLEDAYAEANAGGSEVTLARTTLRSSTGFALEFEVAIGDGGETFAAWSPYALARNGGFDTTDYIPVD